MENITNYTEVLSVEERINLENLINKLAVRGIKQYYTQAATILFEKQNSLTNIEQKNKLYEKTI